MCNTNGLRPRERRRNFRFFENKTGDGVSSEATKKGASFNKIRKNGASFTVSSHFFLFQGFISRLFTEFT